MKKRFEKPEITRIRIDFSESIVASNGSVDFPFATNVVDANTCYVIGTSKYGWQIKTPNDIIEAATCFISSSAMEQHARTLGLR